MKSPEPEKPKTKSDLTPTRDGLLPRFIKAEANLLRLPLFALHTKGLRTLDGIECRGKLTRDGTVHEFVFRATRNTATPYPGPLARSAHLAFLSVITERGFPLQNPITWSWRDLCRRMGISCSGRTVERLKAAIRSTRGLMISSQHALYSKSAGRMIRTQERDLGLYDEVAFASEVLPSGEVADTNYLWLSEWYLLNLNALFTAPLDYELWRRLDERSAIASRLYEFLLLNFYAGVPVLKINYERLAQFLPVRPERYESDARRQLDPALRLLEAMEVIDAAVWSGSKEGLAQLHFHRGKHLTSARDKEPIPSGLVEEFTGSVEVDELRSLKPPEWMIVAEFYRLWANQENHRPTKKELEQARALIEQYGQARVRSLLQIVVKMMRKKWPDAKTFGGIGKYIDEAAAAYDREQKRLESERQEQARRRSEREECQRQQAEREQFVTQWKPRWDDLPEDQREAIRRAVIAENPFLAKIPRMIESLCLEELASRQGAAEEPEDHFTLRF